jgi:cyclomaltodextrin glucanotransferase
MRAKLTLIFAVLLAGCGTMSSVRPPAPPADYYGTLEPFAAENVYFVLTDRFVNGDPGNDQRGQGGDNRTFDRPTPGTPAGVIDNIGYLGGDFKGIADHAGYITDMGFTALWLTPIVDNPDEAFTGGDPAVYGASMSDGGKTGYHGYWGVNFYQLDEHLPSADMDFADLTATLRASGLKTVLDVVANHGSPSSTMPVDQPKYGELYDRDGTLVADHQNLPPDRLKPEENPLHRFYRDEKDLVQLSNLDDRRPEVLEYLVGAYTQWLDQGADALRIDTIGHMPHAFWQAFNARIRAHRPGIFLFGERFAFEPEKIAEHTWPENGGMSVLDFPLKGAMTEVFEKPGSDFATIEKALFLEDGPYANPYELTTFYDNHDMPRMNASDAGFIDAHNLLFTARGIPVIYYGSEIGFMRGTAEHKGNRNYFGAERVRAAPEHPIHQQLKRIAQLRKTTPALQRGLQVNLEFAGDRAAFLRVLQHGDVQQTALVLLNKGDSETAFALGELLPAQLVSWRSAFDGSAVTVGTDGEVRAVVPAHGVQVYLYDGILTDPAMRARLDRAMAKRVGKRP